jgi:sugar lactone lactonase YvrE
MKIVRLEAPRCAGGENPMWDPAARVIYYIDNTGRKVHRFDPATEQSRTWTMPSVVTTLVLRKVGGAVVTLADGIYYFDFDSEGLELVDPLPSPPTYVYNDGKVDRRGRFLVGASTRKFSAPEPDGGLFRMDPDGTVTKLQGDIHYSNGPCFAPDDKTFYFADSWLKSLYAYDYEIETGRVRNRRPFISTAEFGGLPDGATVDRDGLVWVSIYGGGKVVAYRPSGKVERVIDMPAKLVSSVAFGGGGLEDLYVTTISQGALGEPPEESAGYLYRIEGLGARGLAEPYFGG